MRTHSAGPASALAGALVLALALLAGRFGGGQAASPAQPAPTALPPLPAGWPTTVQLDMDDYPGGTAEMQATAPFGFRYKYLAGGVNTGNGWATWNPDGAFATAYIQESADAGMIPVFTYYMLYQSAPGGHMGEADGVYANLQDPATMRAYYEDVHLLLQRAAAFPDRLVVLHVEPDLWGYLQQRARDDDAATVPVRVAATGLPELADLPDDAAGFARAFARLRDTYAPNVVLAYHLSIWGTGTDIYLSNSSEAEVDALATRAARFFTSLGASFDLVFDYPTDRDAAFKQFQYGDGGASWWDAADYARNARFLATFVQLAQMRVVEWSIPYGNTRMRAMDNTWNHYQDNHVEMLLEDPARAQMAAYVRAGVVAFLFGRGADGATNASDANQDGITNPPPINGNDRLSLNADDDGGFFRELARAYYAAGPLPLPELADPPVEPPTGPPLPEQ